MQEWLLPNPPPMSQWVRKTVLLLDTEKDIRLETVSPGDILSTYEWTGPTLWLQWSSVVYKREIGRTEKVPRAQICLNHDFLPYETFEDLQEKFLMTVKNGQGFERMN